MPELTTALALRPLPLGAAELVGMARTRGARAPLATVAAAATSLVPRERRPQVLVEAEVEAAALQLVAAAT